ncbi:DUF3576 domain-containing protein [Shimia sp. SDUM112013]|uniref:DUF3576 domain-containing protein n=1 Tax=Shimia sp. SDUM112013 TaxID=3136160 RepID=UPI0032EE0E49
MKQNRVFGTLAVCAALMALASCGNRNATGASAGADAYLDRDDVGNPVESDQITGAKGTTVWDLFGSDNSDVTVRVNKYLWAASLEVLDFLPIQTVDPFSGVIVTGYGRPPGGGRSYRATVYIRDPALDARSLHVAMQTSGGSAVSPGTVKAVEDAILTRARQLRIADGKL